MAALILEIHTRGLFQYHPLDRQVTTIGRALDNDVILSDPTVEPHHAKIELRDDERVEIENLAGMNPAKVAGRTVDSRQSVQTPATIEIGRVQLRVLPRDHPVNATRPLAGNGLGGRLFSHAAWSVLLVFACLVLGALDFYENAHNAFKPSDLLKYLLQETVLTLGIFVLSLAVLERLLIHRWEVRQLVSAVSLTYLAYFGVGRLAGGLDYLLSAYWPGTLLFFGWYLAAIPAAIAFYLVQLSHLELRRGILLAILIASPIAVPGLLQDPRFQVLFDDFSAAARYHSSLSSLNWHLDRRISIDEFVSEAQSLEAGEFAD